MLSYHGHLCTHIMHFSWTGQNGTNLGNNDCPCDSTTSVLPSRTKNTVLLLYPLLVVAVVVGVVVGSTTSSSTRVASSIEV